MMYSLFIVSSEFLLKTLITPRLLRFITMFVGYSWGCPLGKRYAALLEVCLVSLVLAFIVWLHEAYLSGILLGFSFKTFMVFVTLLAIVLPRRSFRVYGFIPRSLHFTLKWSLVFVAVFIVPAIVSIAVSVALGVAKLAKLSLLGIALNVVFFMVFVGLVEEAYFRGYV